MPQELPHTTSLEVILQAAQEQTNADTTLTEAKQRIAESYGFLTWRQLEVHLHIGHEERETFEHLACLAYVWWDHPKRREQARQMLRANSHLEHESIWAACTAGNVQAVETFLKNEPTLLEARGGYFDWEPLLYACYSRLELPERSTSDVVHLLLDQGANPNAYYRWGGIYVFSALTGVFGEGERGPRNQPIHADCLRLARRLLKAGADANDSQALYNRMFQPDNTTLDMLLEHGLTSKHYCNWYETVNGELKPNSEKTLDYQLQWAVKSNFIDRVKLLLAHGADATQKLRNDGRLTKIARVRGFNEVADALERHGGQPYRLDRVEQFLNYCANAQSDQARDMLARSPHLIEQANKNHPNTMNQLADLGHIEAIQLMIDLGFNVEGDAPETPLHHAAHHGHLELVQQLLSRGASLHRRDPFYCATPLRWAQVGDRTNVVKYLAQLDLGLFDLIDIGDVERVEKYLDSNPEALNAPLRDSVVEPLKEHSSAWQTPLAYAALQGNTSIVNMLLARGANSMLQNDEGTPLQDLCNDEVRTLLK